MTEDIFWNHLQFLVSGELARSEAARTLGLWCDGIVRERIDLSSHPARVHGKAWVGPDGQGDWTFVLTLRQRPADEASIVWARALPTSDDTGWLRFDAGVRRLWIDPPPSAVRRTTPSVATKAGVEDDIDACLELARRTGAAVDVLGSGLPADRFVRLVLVFNRRFGDPDWPSCSYDWREHMGVTDGPFVVWDFDYYAVTLRLADRQVLLQWHAD